MADWKDLENSQLEKPVLTCEYNARMRRREFLGGLAALPLAGQSQPQPVIERAVSGQPHRGKVLLAIQAHSDDIPLLAAGTVAKLVEEGYTGYLVRGTND